MHTTTIRWHIAKASFQGHGIDARGEIRLQKRPRKASSAPVLRTCNLPSVVRGLSKCSRALRSGHPESGPSSGQRTGKSVRCPDRGKVTTRLATVKECHEAHAHQLGINL